MTLSLNITEQQQRCANIILECYQYLEKKHSNIVLELLGEPKTLFQWEHHPKKDVIFKDSQYYYHSHPSTDDDRLPEHGHFHLFIRHPITLTSTPPLAISSKHLRDPKKDDLCHLFGIAMNELGQPTAFFTVNHWVIHGLWFPAPIVCDFLEHFCAEEQGPYGFIGRWLNALLGLFKEQIQLLLIHRDTIIADWAKEHPSDNTLADRSLEVTSVYRW